MKRKDKRISRLGVLLITLAVLAALIATAVFAAFLRNSDEVENTFKPADSVTPEISEKFEEFDNTVKKDVYFEVGDTEYPVYVRAAIVITWQKDGIVYFSRPDEATPILNNDDEIIGYNGDYTIDLNTDDWKLQEDGFYYFKNSVASGDETSILINECRQINAAPVEGYTLSVEILVQTIQAVGSTDGENGAPVIDAWEDAGWNVLN